MTKHPRQPDPPATYQIENPPMQLYMYRAQSDEDYPVHNVNTADLAGVMWYIHNEIVGFPEKTYRIRHFNITRIIRYHVTILNPKAYFDEHQRKFGPFTAYDAGKCGIPHCSVMFEKYGGLVGCQAADRKVAAYASRWKTQPPEANCGDCKNPLWFSLPGPCPEHEYGAKTADCVWNSPGGDCGSDRAISGARDCTYHAEWYGEIRLDDLLDFKFSDGSKGDFAAFLAAGGREYDKETDSGTFTNFWDGILDADKNNARMATITRKFREAYPNYPSELQETDILCDQDGWHPGEFGSDPVPGA